MREINFNPTIKQFEAWNNLNDPTVSEILYGGAAGSGKSMLGCAWLIISCLAYPGSRWLMGRSKLKTLKSTTLKSFTDLIRKWKLQDDIRINNQSDIIYFNNGSEIYMKDLFSYPSDPEFDSLGSLEITGAFIDEVSQVSRKAYEIVQTRIRYRLDEFGITPKLFMSCNPSKGWLYNDFYKPFKEGTLSKYKRFIPALPSDNPYVDSNYIEQLKKQSRATQERLLYGNWDYSDDLDSLFRYENLTNMLINYDDVLTTGNRYITADIARLGKDKTIIMVWDGLTIINIFEYNKITTNVSANHIKDISIKYNIPNGNILIDADGVGGGVVDQLQGVLSFINNSKPILNNEPQIYSNLKSQCYYKLSEYIENNKIKVVDNDGEIFELLCQELQTIKQKNMDSDGKLSIIPKDQMKRILGRSPDYADTLMMRMYFELKNINPTFFRVYGSGNTQINIGRR